MNEFFTWTTLGTCAAAIRRGSPNGEMEEAMEAYESAKTAYYHFVNEQAAEHIMQD